MKVDVIGIRFEPEGIVVDWTSDADQRPEGSTFHQTQITSTGEENWEHVRYYAMELRQDAEELVQWFEKYRRGIVDA